jgi:hypothetical protein
MEINVGGTTFILGVDQVGVQKLEKKEKGGGFRLFLNLKLCLVPCFSKIVSLYLLSHFKNSFTFDPLELES